MAHREERPEIDAIWILLGKQNGPCVFGEGVLCGETLKDGRLKTGGMS